MLNCYPLNDEREHELNAQCWCEPDVLWLDPDTGLPWTNPHASPFIVHHAADCREVSEAVTGESVSDDQRWETVVD